jgi:hypothetical protein
MMSEESKIESFEGGECPCGERTMGMSHEAEPLEELEGSARAADSTSGESGPTPEEIQEMMGNLPPELLAPDLPMLLASIAATLEEQAWRHLGLMANPVTRQIEKDMQKAKIAIDVVAYIVTQVTPLVSDSQRRELQNKVSTLQMNFVEQSRRA